MTRMRIERSECPGGGSAADVAISVLCSASRCGRRLISSSGPMAMAPLVSGGDSGGLTPRLRSSSVRQCDVCDGLLLRVFDRPRRQHQDLSVCGHLGFEPKLRPDCGDCERGLGLSVMFSEGAPQWHPRRRRVRGRTGVPRPGCARATEESGQSPLGTCDSPF